MTHSGTHIAIVCNPTSENDKALKAADTVVKILNRKGLALSIFTTYWPKDWSNFTHAWIFGGDGTLNHFINENSELKIPLAVFPSGSANDFHWMLYGNINLEDQVEKILSGNTQAIDAGSCNGKLFINGVGIGFDGAIVKDLIGKKKLSGKTSYFITVLKNIISYREKFCNIELPDYGISQDCFMISAANAKRYGGGFLVAPKASLTDGLLDINIVGKIPPLKRMRYLPVIEKGEHLELPFIQYYQKDKVIIKSSTELPAHLDGEFLTASRFEIKCLPKKFLFSV